MRGQFVGTGEGGGEECWHIVIEGIEEVIYVGTEELKLQERWL